MKRLSKMLSLILVLIILLSTILPVLCNLSKVFANTYSVEYHGKVSYGSSTVGSFTVNGARAFCMDHDKDSPPTNTEVNEELYNNTNIAKCLYYGWGRCKTMEWFY